MNDPRHAGPTDPNDDSVNTGETGAPGLRPLLALAAELGVLTRYVDGLGRSLEVPVDSLLAVCSALGPELESPDGATAALEELRAVRSARALPAVVVAWNGEVGDEVWATLQRHAGKRLKEATVHLEDGGTRPLTEGVDAAGRRHPALPPGYHRIRLETDHGIETCTVISTPRRAWHAPDPEPSWGLSAHLPAVRSGRSRSVGDLRDLERLAGWVAQRGGDVLAVLPLLPTFNRPPAEPSPYAPVSRLFWSELILDLGPGHRPTPTPSRIDVEEADREVRAALAHHPEPHGRLVDDHLRRYARFRGAQSRLGRDWRSWPAEARDGSLRDEQVDPEEERFHLVAQVEARHQLRSLRDRLGEDGFRIGLDLAVGVHADGFDVWSRPHLFAEGMSVGAPPDRAFPSGQDWGFPPVDPTASREGGHAYTAAAVAHQADLAGVLRVDHVMSLSRLFWIPGGGDVRHGTYVEYPMEELLAVLVLESHRNRCAIVGENLGVVPPEIDDALPEHAVHGMFLAQFEAERTDPAPPSADEVAMIGNHDTATLVGWLDGRDIDERVLHGLADPEAAQDERRHRDEIVQRLMDTLCGGPAEPEDLLDALLDWLGRAPGPLVVPWVEDLWLEPEPVNVPGTASSQRLNWQRPWRRLLDEVMADPVVRGHLDTLDSARRAAATPDD